jgi:hypothetical protein
MLETVCVAIDEVTGDKELREEYELIAWPVDFGIYEAGLRASIVSFGA